MAQKIASKLKINGIQYKLKDDSALTEKALQQKGFATQTYVQGFISGSLEGLVTQNQVHGILDSALEGVATSEQIQGVVKDNLLNYPDRQEVEGLIQQGASGYVTQEQLTNTIGDINALLDTINGEQI